MSFLHKLEAGMAMDDEAWARHANPWSFYTRIAGSGFLAAAVWSRVWLGWWAMVPVALGIAWLWINPRAFRAPANLDNWASRAVLGEQVFLNRQAVPVPPGHVQAANLLVAVSAVGTILLIYGVWALHIWVTVTGYSLMVVGKLWFVDRMVWLYQDMGRPGMPVRGRG
jgi:hypothetical protein